MARVARRPGVTHDVIVVGSGVGGLTAALVGARGGLKVVVVEALRQFGGYLNPFSRKGFTFDTGLHYDSVDYRSSTNASARTTPGDA